MARVWIQILKQMFKYFNEIKAELRAHWVKATRTATTRSYLFVSNGLTDFHVLRNCYWWKLSSATVQKIKYKIKIFNSLQRMCWIELSVVTFCFMYVQYIERVWVLWWNSDEIDKRELIHNLYSNWALLITNIHRTSKAKQKPKPSIENIVTDWICDVETVNLNTFC